MTSKNKKPENRRGATLTEPETFEHQMVTTLPPILVAVAIFCLTIMALESESKRPLVDEIFGTLGLVSLGLSAWIIDYRLDNLQLKMEDRFKLMNGGYFVFCLIIGSMNSAILLLYYVKKTEIRSARWSYIFIPFILMSAAIVGKLMVYSERFYLWSIATALLFAWSMVELMRIWVDCQI